MKALKYILSIVLLFTAVWSCDDDEFGDIDFVSSAIAPTEVSALFSVAQDNTGNVTITPNSTGGVVYEIHFGDSTPEPAKIDVGESVSHTYAEENYDVKIIAAGITGLKTEVTQPLEISFMPPEIVDIEVKNDEAISYKVHVTVTADYAVSYDVYFGEPGNDSFLTANIGDTVPYPYAEAGTYSVKVVVKGAAIATTERTFDVEAKKITQPIEKAPKPSSRMTDDVISIFSNEYTNVEGTNFNPGWGQSTVYNEFELDGDDMLQYSNLNYQGIEYGSDVDASSMEYLHIDVWTADLAALEINAISRSTGEKFVVKDLVPEQWNSFDIPLSVFTDQGVSMADLFQFKFAGMPWAGDGFGTIFVDNLYFWKFPSAPSPLVGTWMIAPEDGALKVSETPGGNVWWYLNQWGDDVTTRACLMDDEYVFSADGTFSNVLGDETWLENWQGDGTQHDVCGTPIAPHDGSNPATWSSSDTSVTVSGLGAYLGIPKPHNTAEDGAPVNNTITYNYVLSEDGNSLELTIQGFNGGAEWYFKLVRKPNPLVGTWKIAPEDGALKVSETPGGNVWWYLNQWGDDVTTRACLMDDEYVFSADGTFSNVLGDETWLENWQGDGTQHDVCGTPIAPHDGSNPATWSSSDTSVTVSGLGAYLGIPKPHNTAEDGAPVNNTITYNYVLSEDGNSLELTIQGFNGGAEWYFKLVKQ